MLKMRAKDFSGFLGFSRDRGVERFGELVTIIFKLSHKDLFFVSDACTVCIQYILYNVYVILEILLMFTSSVLKLTSKNPLQFFTS